MTTEDLLLQKYGPLLTLEQLAVLLDRSINGLRFTLRGDTEFARRLRPYRRRIGRRIYYKTTILAELIDAEQPS